MCLYPLQKLREEDHYKFKGSLVYTVSSILVRLTKQKVLVSKQTK